MNNQLKINTWRVFGVHLGFLSWMHFIWLNTTKLYVEACRAATNYLHQHEADNYCTELNMTSFKWAEMDYQTRRLSSRLYPLKHVQMLLLDPKCSFAVILVGWHRSSETSASVSNWTMTHHHKATQRMTAGQRHDVNQNFSVWGKLMLVLWGVRSPGFTPSPKPLMYI